MNLLGAPAVCAFIENDFGDFNFCPGDPGYSLAVYFDLRGKDCSHGLSLWFTSIICRGCIRRAFRFLFAQVILDFRLSAVYRPAKRRALINGVSDVQSGASFDE